MTFSGDPRILKYASIYVKRFLEAIKEMGIIGSGAGDAGSRLEHREQQLKLLKSLHNLKSTSSGHHKRSRHRGDSNPFFDQLDLPPFDFRFPTGVERALWPTVAPKSPVASTSSPEKRVAETDLDLQPDVKKSKSFEDGVSDVGDNAADDDVIDVL